MVILERLIILSLGFLIGSFIQEETQFLSLTFTEEIKPITTPCSNLSQLIEYDLRMMSLQKDIPISIDQIQNVQIHSESKVISDLIKTCSLTSIENKTGKFILDIEAFDFHDEEGEGIIAQYSLISVNTKNKIWETAHSLKLPHFEQKKSSVPKD